VLDRFHRDGAELVDRDRPARLLALAVGERDAASAAKEYPVAAIASGSTQYSSAWALSHWTAIAMSWTTDPMARTIRASNRCS
jgi:hypothetical protein